MKARLLLTFPLILTTIVAGAGSAIAQDSRADAIRQQQAERQQHLSPPQKNTAERLLERLERWGFISGPPRGVYPWGGSIYSGGGFAAGAGARQPFGDDGAVNVFSGYSIGGSTIAHADVHLPTFADGRGTISVAGRYIDAPDVKYFGIGNDTSKDDRTRFGFSPVTSGARLEFDVTKRLTAAGGITYLDATTSGGRTAPSIEERFEPSDTPGLEYSTFAFVNSTVSAVYDWRRRLGYAGRGGLLRAKFDDYRDRDHGRYSFRSLEADALQLIPVLRANWVIALRGGVTITDVDGANDVPFFLMPAIGGGSSVRGYPDFRFRDRNRLVMNAELRWTPARFMDMALFYDAGKVEARRQDLDLDNLKTGYGIGMRLIGPMGYAFRVEAARSREHRARLIISAGGAF
jgi:hypothetical protein